MPRIHAIFEQFVSDLSELVKERVAESVEKATSDFLGSKFMEPKKVRRRRRRGKTKVGKPGRKPGWKPAPKSGKVRLSKNGKRIGRPPKQK